MKTTLSSKERILTAINHQEPDRIPILFDGIAPLEHLWKNEFEQVDVLLKLGVDARLTVGVGSSVHPDVTTRSWVDKNADSGYPLVFQEWYTPKGTIRAVMRRSDQDGGQYPDGVPLEADQNVSHGVEMPIKGRDDLPKLAYLLQEPNKEDVAKFRERHKQLKIFTTERGILLEAYPGPGVGLDMAYRLCGHNLFYLTVDDPGFTEELLTIIHRVSLKNLEILLDAGVDCIVDTNVYQIAPLWSPQYFDKHFAPRLKQKVDMAHQAGVKYSSRGANNYMPHLDSFLQTGVDVLSQINPELNDMRVLKAKIGHRICLKGGVHPEHDIELATVSKTRGAVIDAIQAAAQGGGFILSTGGSMFPNTTSTKCYDNVMAFIHTGLEFGSYPIDFPALSEARQKLSV